MALSPALGHGLSSEPLSHPLGAPRELDVAVCSIIPAEETNRWGLGLAIWLQGRGQWKGPRATMCRDMCKDMVETGNGVWVEDKVQWLIRGPHQHSLSLGQTRPRPP